MNELEEHLSVVRAEAKLVDNLRKALETAERELAVAKSLHDVAVQQRDAAWREIEDLKAEISALRAK